MVRAFGYCNDVFRPHYPGRLCRGRERWVEGLPDSPDATLHRTVCSGAVFSDDSARDARRGFRFSGVEAGRLMAALFPGAKFHGFCEGGDPRALPAKMSVEEDHLRSWWGGARQSPAVRWLAPATPQEIDIWMAGELDGLAAPLADGFVVLDKAPTPALIEALYHLVAFADPVDRPARKYAAAAVPEVLAHARALVLLHLDKHAPTLAIYTPSPLQSDGVIDLCARAAEAFPVPFAIPPMLARWDRALYELRMDWNPEHDGEFPVPPADDAGGRWSARRRQVEEAKPEAEAAAEEE